MSFYIKFRVNLLGIFFTLVLPIAAFASALPCDGLLDQNPYTQLLENGWAQLEDFPLDESEGLSLLENLTSLRASDWELSVTPGTRFVFSKSILPAKDLAAINRYVKKIAKDYYKATGIKIYAEQMEIRRTDKDKFNGRRVNKKRHPDGGYLSMTWAAGGNGGTVFDDDSKIKLPAGKAGIFYGSDSGKPTLHKSPPPSHKGRVFIGILFVLEGH